MAQNQQKKLNLSLTTPLGAGKLKIQKLTGEERISGLFRFELAMVSAENDLAFSGIVGENVTISMDYGDGNKRYFHGIVGRFIQSGSEQRFTTYYAEIYPWLWLLTLAQDSRIFQNKTVPEIIKQVFSDLNQTGFEDALKGTYQPREYCVQYQESSFNFVTRLMEEEGIFYFFKHEDSRHTLVLADDPSNHENCEGIDTLRMGQSFTRIQDEDILLRCTLEERVNTGKYAVDDFNFETPSNDLVQEAGSSSNTYRNKTAYRIYEYPGGFTVTSDGQTLVDKRLQVHEAPTKMLRGESFCRGLVPGYKFTLSEHDRSDVNGAYVLNQVSHHATQDGYRNSFTAFEAAVPFRPPRIAKKPRIAGSQTAIVVGPSGEEIHSDQYGRIKVQFHWDQEGGNDENSSCWIRVAQGWAGKSWGSIFIPRIGQEVVVGFLDGDPDRPLITGSVYNAEQTVPYALPGNQTKSTIQTRSTPDGKAKNFNEIRFEDKKGKEELYIHAEKDMNVMVENNRTTTIGDPDTAKDGSETLTIKNNRTTTIKEGNETLGVEKGNRTTTVKKGNDSLNVDQGNRTITIGKGNHTLLVSKGNRTVNVKKGTETHHVKGDRTVNLDTNETRTIKKNFTQTVNKNFTLKVSGDLVIDVTGKVTIKSGKDLLIQSGAKLTCKSTADLTNDAGANLTNKAAQKLTNKAGLKLVNQATSITNDASAKLENKAGGMHDVTAGGILKLGGSLIKIN